MDAGSLGKLLPVLRENGVKHFKCSDFELEFHPDPVAEAKAQTHAAEELKKQAAEQEAQLPPDLRASELTKEDTILNWSAPSGHEEERQVETMPLTGDAPIEPPSPDESPA